MAKANHSSLLARPSKGKANAVSDKEDSLALSSGSKDEEEEVEAPPPKKKRGRPQNNILKAAAKRMKRT